MLKIVASFGCTILCSVPMSSVSEGSDCYTEYRCILVMLTVIVSLPHEILAVHPKSHAVTLQFEVLCRHGMMTLHSHGWLSFCSSIFSDFQLIVLGRTNDSDFLQASPLRPWKDSER